MNRGVSISAASVALILSEKYRPPEMTVLTNGKRPEFSVELLTRIRAAGIRIIESPIVKISDKKNQLSGFQLENGESVECEIGFVSLGIRPNNDLALLIGAQVDDTGLVITDSNGESSVPNLFIVGDLRSKSRKQIYTAWEHAVDSIQVITRRISDARNP